MPLVASVVAGALGPAVVSCSAGAASRPRITSAPTSQSTGRRITSSLNVYQNPVWPTFRALGLGSTRSHSVRCPSIDRIAGSKVRASTRPQAAQISTARLMVRISIIGHSATVITNIASITVRPE